jgi:hypothetical protein
VHAASKFSVCLPPDPRFRPRSGSEPPRELIIQSPKPARADLRSGEFPQLRAYLARAYARPIAPQPSFNYLSVYVKLYKGYTMYRDQSLNKIANCIVDISTMF